MTAVQKLVIDGTANWGANVAITGSTAHPPSLTHLSSHHHAGRGRHLSSPTAATVVHACFAATENTRKSILFLFFSSQGLTQDLDGQTDRQTSRRKLC